MDIFGMVYMLWGSIKAIVFVSASASPSCELPHWWPQERRNRPCPPSRWARWGLHPDRDEKLGIYEKKPGNMMGIWWEYDGNMMEIWWKYDGNMMEIWWKSFSAPGFTLRQTWLAKSTTSLTFPEKKLHRVIIFPFSSSWNLHFSWWFPIDSMTCWGGENHPSTAARIIKVETTLPEQVIPPKICGWNNITTKTWKESRPSKREIWPRRKGICPF